MARVQCIATCYMPARAAAIAHGAAWERFEDEYNNLDGDVYTVPGNRLQEFLGTKFFVLVSEEDDD